VREGWTSILTLKAIIFSSVLKDINMEIEKKAQNLEEAVREMLPFALYTAIPIIITITIAFTFGTK
jgi:hypothetical protein